MGEPNATGSSKNLLAALGLDSKAPLEVGGIFPIVLIDLAEGLT
jgi:hypothetical protein